MDVALNRKSLSLGVPGIALQLAGWSLPLLMNGGERPTTEDTGGGWPMLVFLAGTMFLVGGLSLYARAKGRSPWWGVMAFLSIIGLIVLACLKDRSPSPQRRL